MSFADRDRRSANPAIQLPCSISFLDGRASDKRWSTHEGFLPVNCRPDLAVSEMIAPLWTIDVSRTFGEIEQQVIAIVKQMEELGAFDQVPRPVADNDN